MNIGQPSYCRNHNDSIHDIDDEDDNDHDVHNDDDDDNDIYLLFLLHVT